jgi:hypothetical protein
LRKRANPGEGDAHLLGPLPVGIEKLEFGGTQTVLFNLKEFEKTRSQVHQTRILQYENPKDSELDNPRHTTSRDRPRFSVKYDKASGHCLRFSSISRMVLTSSEATGFLDGDDDDDEDDDDAGEVDDDVP